MSSRVLKTSEITKKKAALAILASLCVSACNNDQAEYMRESKILELRQQVDSLELKVASIGISNKWYDVVQFSPGDESHRQIDTPIGRQIISLGEISPYANGSKVTLRFGNITSVEIDGISVELEWGALAIEKPPAPFLPSEHHEENVHSKTMRARKICPPGKWTDFEFILEGVPPSELGFIRAKNVSYDAVNLK